VIHAGTVVGAYGFGYDTVHGRHERGDQLGYVVIEDDVEIGANATIDRGTYGPTVIGQGTKIDNLVMVAHNCHIGRHNLICSQVGIAGSSSSGNYVVMAGQVGVPDHVRIGHRAVLGAKAGVMRDVADDTTVLGLPATPERDQLAKQAALARLPDMRRQLRDLIRQVEQLAQKVERLEKRDGDSTLRPAGQQDAA
jgi:UDP-3-O-[3-hydroxymyristoyl] glucosamine N-acyltransferase